MGGLDARILGGKFSYVYWDWVFNHHCTLLMKIEHTPHAERRIPHVFAVF
jgi:hypothetical protein